MKINISILVNAPFSDFDLFIINDIVSSKMYDQREDFNSKSVYFPFLEGDFTPFLLMVYIIRSLFVLRVT